jgi:hypothetical protein
MCTRKLILLDVCMGVQVGLINLSGREGQQRSNLRRLTEELPHDPPYTHNDKCSFAGQEKPKKSRRLYRSIPSDT